jgi:hypothetical protein
LLCRERALGLAEVSTKAVLLLLLLLLLLWTKGLAEVVDRFDLGRLNRLALLLLLLLWLLLPVFLLSVRTGMAAPVLGILPAKEPAGL